MYGKVKLHPCHISFHEMSLSIMGSRACVDEAVLRKFLLLLDIYLCSFRPFPIHADLAGMIPEFVNSTKEKILNSSVL
jgi:hypothetical protein